MNYIQKDPNNETHSSEKIIPSELADDQFYQAIGAMQRRRLLFVLLDNPESTIDELAILLCGWEATTTEKEQTSDDLRNQLLRLKHIHLPQLEAAGLIEYNQTEGSVLLKPLPETITDIIRLGVAAERSPRQ